MSIPNPNPPTDEDILVPERQFRAEVGSPSDMTWWRWKRDPVIAIPPAIKIRGRNFQWRSVINATKARLAALQTESADHG